VGEGEPAARVGSVGERAGEGEPAARVGLLGSAGRGWMAAVKGTEGRVETAAETAAAAAVLASKSSRRY
jgi:hypothetical protein